MSSSGTGTASAFSSSDTAALERETETENQEVNYEQIWNENHRKVSSDWIRQNGYKRVCILVILRICLKI